MKILLDENLPFRLRHQIKGHQVFTVSEKGWAGFTNGKLLQKLIEENFDALLTFDKNIQHQQNFQKYPVAVLNFYAADNRFESLKALFQK